MSTRLREWLPMVLCSAPGVVVAGIALIGIAFWGTAFANSPLGLGLITLAVLACPLNMVLTMMINRRAASGSSSAMASCCMPGQTVICAPASSAADRLRELRVRRTALEREVVELRQV